MQHEMQCRLSTLSVPGLYVYDEVLTPLRYESIDTVTAPAEEADGVRATIRVDVTHVYDSGAVPPKVNAVRSLIPMATPETVTNVLPTSCPLGGVIIVIASSVKLKDRKIRYKGRKAKIKKGKDARSE